MCSLQKRIAPVRSEDNKGLKGWFFKRYQKKAGGAVPSANRITLLRDADGDGIAETRSVLLANLNSPFGMALVDDQLYIANTDARACQVRRRAVGHHRVTDGRDASPRW
jgi:glucose/arabinose dehydrogenase